MTEETDPNAETIDPSIEESTGDEALDRRLAEPILKGDRGLDTAQIWISGFLIVLAGVIAYSNAIAIPFHGADIDLLVNNTALHHPAAFGQSLDPIRPRTAAMFSLALNWWITKGNATSFHVVNLAIHLVNALLVFLLCRLLLRGKASEAISMLAGLVFVLHPALTESVNLAVGRAELLATLFSLVALLLFAKATKDPSQVRYGALGASWLCYLLAMASHETAFFLPFFLILFHYRVGTDSPSTSQRLLYLPYLGLMLVWAVSHASGTGLNPFRDVVGYISTGRLASRLYHTLYPAGLSVWRDSTAVAASSGLPRSIAMDVFMALVLAAVCRFRSSVIAWAIALWTFGFVFVELTTLPGAFVSDRDQYFPLVGAALLLPSVLAGVLTAPPARVIGGLVAAALVIASGVATFSRNNTWIDEPTLWQDAANKAPASAKPQQVLGQYYLALGRDQLMQIQTDSVQSGRAPDDQKIRAATDTVRQAERYFAKAKEFDANDPKTLAGLGAAQSLTGRPKEAVENLLSAVRIDTENQSTTLSLAIALDDSWRTTGKRDDMLRAIDYFNRAETLGPVPVEASARYGMDLFVVGDHKGAEAALRAAIGSDTNSPLAAPLKEAQNRQAKIESATSKILTLLDNQPNNADGLRVLGQVYILSGHYLSALYTANQVLKDAPQDLEAWIQMGIAEARLNSIDQFVSEWPAPPSSSSTSAWEQLSLTCASLGMWDEAQAYLVKQSGGAAAQPPLLKMGEIALQLKQARRAWDYLRRAAEASPDDPRPWLHLADIAAANKDTKSASDFLVEAAKRNAEPNEVASRRQKLEVAAPQPLSGPVKTMIR